MGSAALSLRSLADMSRVLVLADSLDDVLESAAEHACVALGAATVSISRIDDSRDVIRTLINVGDLGPCEIRWPDNEVYPIAGDRRLTLSVREQRSQVDSLLDPDCEPTERELLLRLGKGSSVSVPIVVDAEVWGEFYATAHSVDADIFNDEAIAYAEVLAAMLASAISRVQREADLELLAFRDPLTGVFNRRALDDWAAEIFSAQPDEPTLVSVVAVDIDGLKVVNDTEGHASGDAYIRSVAHQLSSAFEHVESSMVARVGGDEFTVMVIRQLPSAVIEAVNNVCRTVTGGRRRVGVSAGVASAVVSAGCGVTPSQLFAAADRAQYVAKRSGSVTAVVAPDFHVSDDGKAQQSA